MQTMNGVFMKLQSNVIRIAALLTSAYIGGAQAAGSTFTTTVTSSGTSVGSTCPLLSGPPPHAVTVGCTVVTSSTGCQAWKCVYDAACASYLQAELAGHPLPLAYSVILRCRSLGYNL
jgi:hypothetical protein